MNGHHSWADTLSCRQFLTPPFQYAVLVTSVLFAKALHLFNHLTSLPPVLFLLYLPTFLALDVLVAAACYVLVNLKGHGRTSILLALVRGAVCMGILGASSTQIAFYLETGGEIKWGAAKNFAHDPAGMKLLMSGSLQASCVATAIIITARVVCSPLYNGTKVIMSRATAVMMCRRLRTQGGPSHPEQGETLHAGATLLDQEYQAVLGDEPKVDGSEQLGRYPRWSTRIIAMAIILGTIILLAVRPRQAPYAHMSGTLPFTLLEIWSPSAQSMCQAGYAGEFSSFPLRNLVSHEHWEAPHGRFPGWMPDINSSASGRKDVKPQHPAWLPQERVHGFDRWYDDSTTEGVNYDPVHDPMRITNLDQELLAPIAERLEAQNVTIRHVVMISLESTRKDVFPLKKGSYLYDLIMKTHQSSESAAKADADLSKLTLNAEILTGEGSGFGLKEDVKPSSKSQTWRNLSKGNGGINVVGAFTGSTTTFKSMIGSHCGVQPLPVDFTVEAHGNIYQPCIPSILQLFNRNKTGQSHASGNDAAELDIHSMPWKSVFVQSITDHYDHQDELDQRLGFSKVIVKDTLMDPLSAHYPPTEKESNYFGFPESQVKPYLRDLIRDAGEKKERLFLSHFTSSTHHPWKLPEAAGEEIDYLMRTKWKSEHPLNRYLNTVGYGDKWVGEIMDLLEESGVADQTLVVLVGDHGMAFKEDSKMHSTFENGHISNLRVPLVFFHPDLPRIQLAVNATSISVIPTILDLLVATSSINYEDREIASNLIHQYEGQSLVRPYQVSKNGRQAWNIAVLNAGGGFLSISSAAVPFRLVLPICRSGVYRFTSTDHDPNELHPLEDYSISELAARVKRKYGADAGKWVIDAKKVEKWWVLEQRRRWRYHGASLQNDRSPEEMIGAGTTPKKHWWET